MRKIPFAGIELTSQRVRGLQGTSELPGRPAYGYDLKFLRRKLYNFQATFSRTSKILLAAPCKKTRRIFWHKLVLDVYTNATRPVTVKV